MHIEESLILVLLYSVLSVYSVVLADKITKEHTEHTKKNTKEE